MEEQHPPDSAAFRNESSVTAEKTVYYYAKDHVMGLQGLSEPRFGSRASAISLGILDGLGAGSVGGILVGGVASLLSKGPAFKNWSLGSAAILIPIMIIDNMIHIRSKTAVFYRGEWVDPNEKNLVKLDGRWLGHDDPAWVKAAETDTAGAMEKYSREHPTSVSQSTNRQEQGQSKGDPTPGLFEKVSLISHQFGSKNAYKITGSDLFSIYSVTRTEGTQVELSPDVPNMSGEKEYRGWIWQIYGAVLNGYIWTPRVERIGDIDLAMEDKITALRSLDFQKFKNHKDVIPFANGYYGINLFGAIFEDGAIVKSGSNLTYLNKEGKRLYGRLISEKMEGGKTVLQETILK